MELSAFEKELLLNLDHRFVYIGRDNALGYLYVAEEDEVSGSRLIAFNHLFHFIQAGERYKIEELLKPQKKTNGALIRAYRNVLPRLEQIPDEVYGIYIVPVMEQMNGCINKEKSMFTTFDLVFQNEKFKNIGWKHFDSECLNIFNNIHECALTIDCEAQNRYIHLWSCHKINVGLWGIIALSKDNKEEVQ